MGLIEDRRRQLAQAAIAPTESESARLAREASEREKQNLLAAGKCMEQSGFQPLLELLVPKALESWRLTPGGQAWGPKAFPPEPFPMGERHVGLVIHVSLGRTLTSGHDGYTYDKSSGFHIKFHPDGQIAIEAGPGGSTALPVSYLSRNPKLGEEVLEKAYSRPLISERRERTPHDPIF